MMLRVIEKNNTLEYWQQSFERIGITRSLIKDTFQSCEVLPNLEQLHEKCLRLARLYPDGSAHIYSPWQLAFLSGDNKLIESFDLNLLMDKLEANGIHYLALSGPVQAIEAALRKNPDLLYTTNAEGMNIMQYAALSGNPHLALWALQSQPLTITRETTSQKNVLDYAALSGSPEVMAIFADAAKKQKVKLKTDSLIHSAASSGSIPTVEWVMKNFPNSIENENQDGATLLHFAARSGSSFLLEWLLKKYPALCRKLWKADRNNKSPDFYVPRPDSPSPSSVLKVIFSQVLDDIIRQQPLAWQLPVIKEFNEQFIHYLSQDAEFEVVNEAKAKCTNKDIKEILRQRLEIRKLNALAASAKKLTLPLLVQLIQTAEQSLPEGSSSPFLHQLKIFVYHASSVSVEELTPLQTQALAVLMDDCQRTPNAKTRMVDDMVVNLFNRTETLENFRMIPVGDELDIQPGNYQQHYDAILVSLAGLSLPAEVSLTLQNTVMRGIHRLLKDKEQIVDHFSKNHGQLYYLTLRMPLHTENNDREHPEEYRKTLDRLIENLFGAYYVANRAGRLPEFFTLLTQGVCLESRVRDALKWAAEYADIKTMAEHMETALAQYLAYQKVMFGKLDSELKNLDVAYEFIAKRLKGIPCAVDPVYAPKGVIDAAGIKRYLQQVTGYTNVRVPDESEKALICKTLDAKMNGFYFLSYTDKKPALLALRQAFVNSDEPAEELVKRWKTAVNLEAKKTSAEIITGMRFTLFGEPLRTNTEVLVDDLVAWIQRQQNPRLST